MCGLAVTVDGGRVAGIRGNPDDVWSAGHLCPTGTALGQIQDQRCCEWSSHGPCLLSHFHRPVDLARNPLGADLVGAIRSVAEGGSYVDPKVVERLVAAKSAAEQSPLAELTPRELDVLREMARGANNAAIAETLVVTERSVEQYVDTAELPITLPHMPTAAESPCRCLRCASGDVPLRGAVPPGAPNAHGGARSRFSAGQPGRIVCRQGGCPAPRLGQIASTGGP